MQVIETAFLSLDTENVHVHYLFFLAMLYHKSPAVFDSVVKHRAVDERTGFTGLVADGSGGIFTTESHRDSYAGRGAKGKETSIAAIASIYLQNAWSRLNDINIDDINTFDFPKNLLLTVRGELPSTTYSNQGYVPSIRKYAEVIRHAGGFAQKDNDNGT